MTSRRTRMWVILRTLLGFLFIGAGTLHFVRAPLYVEIMPSYLPYPLELVYFSGICEILGGIGVLIPFLRRWAGLGLIALLIAVFPANLNMAINNIAVAGVSLPPLLLWLRLPLQLALIAWVALCTLEPRGIQETSAVRR